MKKIIKKIKKIDKFCIKLIAFNIVTCLITIIKIIIIGEKKKTIKKMLEKIKQ